MSTVGQKTEFVLSPSSAVVATERCSVTVIPDDSGDVYLEIKEGEGKVGDDMRLEVQKGALICAVVSPHGVHKRRGGI